MRLNQLYILIVVVIVIISVSGIMDVFCAESFSAPPNRRRHASSNVDTLAKKPPEIKRRPKSQVTSQKGITPKIHRNASHQDADTSFKSIDSARIGSYDPSKDTITYQSLDTIKYKPEEHLATAADSSYIYQPITVSKGWFPKISIPFWYLSLIYQTGGIIDDAKNIRSAFFAPSANPLGSTMDFDYDERKIYTRYKKDEQEGDGFPGAYYASIGLAFQWRATPWTILHSSLTYFWSQSMIMSYDASKKFTTTEGTIEYIKEGNFVDIYENGLAASAGISIPVWGVWATNVNIGSSFNLYLGGLFKQSLSAETLQFLQIGNHKDKIRYSNGGDTLVLIDNQTLGNTVKSKSYIEVGVQILTCVQFIVMDLGVIYSYPLNSAITDDSWKQHILRVYFQIGFKW